MTVKDEHQVVTGPLPEMGVSHSGKKKSWRMARLGGSMLLEWAKERLGTERYGARCIADDPELTIQAQEMVAKRYFELGKVGEADLAQIEHNGQKVTVLRTDISNPGLSFAVFDADKGNAMVAATTLYPGSVIENGFPYEQLSGDMQQKLLALPTGTVADLGREVKRDRSVEDVVTMKLMREVFGYCLEKGITNLVCGLEPNVYKKYTAIYGGALERLSEETVAFEGFMGPQVPLMIDVANSFNNHRSGELPATKSHMHRMGQAAVQLLVRQYFVDRVPDLKK